jgi:hypothetical protein
MNLKIIIFLLLFAFCTFSESLNGFPLWGSSWIIAQGNNSKIFPSVLPLRPDKLALLEFNSNKSITLHYANLDHRTYRCTSELIDDVKSQFDSNVVSIPYDSIFTGSHINISYQPFNDTVWSGDENVIDYFTKYQQIGRKIGTTDSVFGSGDYNKLRNSPSYFRDKPLYYGKRLALQSDLVIYTIESVDDDGLTIKLENNNYLLKPQSPPKGMPANEYVATDLKSFAQFTPYSNYMKGNYVYEYIPVKYTFKTANIGFWQIHVHPVIWYYPRDPFDGKPYLFDSLKMDYKTACAKKKQSIDSPDKLDLKYYRNPYLSDSASVIISFSFANIPNTDMTSLNSISLTDSTVDITHYPTYMYRVSSYGVSDSWNSYKSALYQLYSKYPEDERDNQNVDNRCAAWQFIDKQNADIIFPPSIQKPGVLVRNKLIDDGIFRYNDCPCSRISELKNLTPVQLQRFALLAPPMCNRSDMVKACNLYSKFMKYLKAPSDQKLLTRKINMLQKIIQEGDKRAAAAGVDWTISNEDCPDTWVNEF